MSYTDLRDFSCEYTGIVGDVTVQIEKLGGGTLGETYSGTWRYIVTRSETGEEIRRAQDCETGMPHTHAWVARFIGCEYSDEDSFDEEEHVVYPHEPGRLDDCAACLERCHCGEAHDESCTHPMGDGKLYHTTQCVWSGHDSDESDCPGHYDDNQTLTSGAGIGEPTYCDGSCQ